MISQKNERFENLRALYIEGIYQTQALVIRDKPMTLQSGNKSHIYLNHRHFLSTHRYLSLMVDIYHELARTIAGEYILGAVDSVVSPILVGAMGNQFSLDYVVIRRSPLSHGTQEYMYGKPTKPVVLIDDMTSTGDTLIDAAEKLRANDGRVAGAIISAYRDETAIKNLKAKDIKTWSIASFTQIIEGLWPSFTEKERQIIESKPLSFR